MTAVAMYAELKQSYNLSQIAQKLNLHKGTLKRWEATNKIPQDYIYDLNFLLGNKYEINKENFRSFNEFFTKPNVAKYCYNAFLEFLKLHKINIESYIFIEPSCGELSFYNLMPESRRLGIDLDSKNAEILKANFLSFKPQDFVRQDSITKNYKLQNLDSKKHIVLGNPPFGLRGNLALRFLNHAANFADFVAFILPPLFDSDGKGAPKGRVKGLTLAHSEKLPLDSFIYPNGKEVEVATLFQIWVNANLIESKVINIAIDSKKTCKNYIKVYSLSDGGTPSSTRNKNMLYKCDLYLPSTCFHSSNKPQMKIYYDFESLPHRRGYGIKILNDRENITKILESINWENVSFKGTNSSLNLRTSLIENALIESGIYDKGLF